MIISFSCESFVELGVPDQKIVSETVFSNDETATNAVRGIYNELFKADFSSGGLRSVSLLGGLSADEIQTTAPNGEMIEFQENEILIENPYNLAIWSSAYNIIYLCNAVIDGLNMYSGVSLKTRTKLIGEVQFVRAFIYFYLVNLFGEVPLILTSDYRVNSLASRSPIEDVYSTIITDLESASISLEKTYVDEERTRPNKYTAMALLARVYLYLGDWKMAKTFSSEIINSTPNYTLLENLNDVFLANSREAIWQISPAGRAMNKIPNESRIFIITSTPPNSQQPVILSNDQVNVFSNKDIRAKHWLGVFSAESKEYYYPYKYKAFNSESPLEYSMVLRLAEQYLIRSESETKLGNIVEAISDLDKIRERSKLDPIMKIKPNISKEDLLDSIYIERQRELFTEWGHRWLDLKRTKLASPILGSKKDGWQATDILYPIPEDERGKNPNLTQNIGY